MVGKYDVIVVGVGAMGSSACFHLARRGARALGLEQFDIPHALGSSHGASRMIRLAYYEHTDYVPLLRRAYELWHDLERLSGQKLLYLTGGLYMGHPEGEVIAGSLRAAKQHGLEHELLSPREVAERFPQFTNPDDLVGLIEPQAGFLVPERVVSAYAEAALRAGAQLHGREMVVHWSADHDGITVRTTRDEYRAKHLILCGGPWTSTLLRDLGVELVVTRQVLAWVWPEEADQFALGKLPVWAIDRGDGTLHYGFPMIPDVPGFKLAHHGPGAQTDPDKVIRDVLPGDEQTFRPILRRMIPAADGPLLSLRICLYTNSPDSHFILDRHPRHRNVTIACGFSGHGFKFASVIGEALTDLALHGNSRLPVHFLSLSRFR